MKQQTLSLVKTPGEIRRAWLWASYYFLVCLMIAATAGVAPYLTSNPIATTAQLRDPLWYAFTCFCILVEIVAYWVILPRGTLTYERKLSLPSVFLFGIAWGVCQGFLLLAIWTIVLRATHSILGGTFIAFVISVAFLWVWHNSFWDKYIAPEHNAPGWRERQFILCHIPNLVVTFGYLAMYGNGALFVLFQTIALLGATFFMRIQPFWRDA